MHQNGFGGRAPPEPAEGAYSAPPEPLAELRGRGRGVRTGERGRERRKGEDPNV